MIPVLIFVIVAFSSLTFAGYAYVLERRRSAFLGRTSEVHASAAAATSPPRGRAIDVARWREWWARLAPAAWVNDPRALERLVQAGYDVPGAATVYAGVRLMLLVALPVVVLLLEIQRPVGEAGIAVLIAAVAAWVLPRAALDRQIRARRERIRRAMPDALDLLVVCVEAGVSLEAAMLRVSRDMHGAHPDLAREMAHALRRIRAGLPRDAAMRGLFARTGVEELRVLASNVMQSERWGSSVARVLRVTAGTLRRKRRQTAEQRAQTAPIKMTVPLILMILPALFILLLGPSLLLLLQALHAA